MNTKTKLSVEMIDRYIRARLDELQKEFASTKGPDLMWTHGQVAELNKLRRIMADHRTGRRHIVLEIDRRPAMMKFQAN